MNIDQLMIKSLAGDYMAYPAFEAAFESGYYAVNQAEKHGKTTTDL